MNTSIFKSLKDDFANSTNPNNRSIVELCIIELASGNFGKAIDLSEELVKKDINDSTGWAMKALSQVYLFDYANNLHLLKSSFAALEEFKAKTTLPRKSVMDVEAIFTATMLSRTIVLVGNRVEEVLDLQTQAKAEKTKSIIAAVTGAYVASKVDSNIDKLMVYGVSGYASAEFQENAEMLEDASKGIFGIAVANMAATVEPAKALKANLNELSFDVRNESTAILQAWIKMLSELYLAVIATLIAYINEVLPNFSLTKKKPFSADEMVNIISSPEAVQFIYLSKLLGVDESVPEFNTIVEQLESIKDIDSAQVKSDFSLGLYIAVAIMLGPLLFTMLFIGPDKAGVMGVVSVVSMMVGMGLAFLFIIKPYGSGGLIMDELKSIKTKLESFHFSANQLIIENIKI